MAITVVDYGLGNLASVLNAVRAVGAEAELSCDASGIARAEALVLPGVGAAGSGMERLRARGLDAAIVEIAAAGRPVLGICLGMQLLFEGSEEGDVECLGLVPGQVRMIGGAEKVPHIGWNQVAWQGHRDLWRDLPAEPYFYFVHSYICEPSEGADVAGTTTHGETFCSAVVRGPIWGTQFHPERSGETGLSLLKNFVRMVENSNRERWI